MHLFILFIARGIQISIEPFMSFRKILGVRLGFSSSYAARLSECVGEYFFRSSLVNVILGEYCHITL